VTDGESTTPRIRVLIAGCGYVGTKLGTLLAATGAEVWGLRRNPAGLPPSIRPIAADLLDPRLAGRLPEVDRVVYATAADSSDQEGYRAAYLDGVHNLLGALEAQARGMKRFLFLSSTAVYGEAKGGWVDEGTPPSPEGFRGEILLDGENAVFTALSGDVTSGVVLRLGGIYGPTRTRLIERVRSGQARCQEGVVEWSNRIHRDDAAGAAQHLLLHPDPAPLYIGVDDEPSPICDVYRYVARRMGVPDPGSPRHAGAIQDSTQASTPEAPPTESGKRCSNRRLRDSGYTFWVPTYREGYAAMLEAEGRSPQG
jgi:nucleoside-diphosphate-sugar epimerase